MAIPKINDLADDITAALDARAAELASELKTTKAPYRVQRINGRVGQLRKASARVRDARKGADWMIPAERRAVVNAVAAALLVLYSADPSLAVKQGESKNNPQKRKAS